MTSEALETAENDARLAMTRDYGYPDARLRCARHTIELAREVRRLQEQALLVESMARGDYVPLRSLSRA